MEGISACLFFPDRVFRQNWKRFRGLAVLRNSLTTREKPVTVHTVRHNESRDDRRRGIRVSTDGRPVGIKRYPHDACEDEAAHHVRPAATTCARLRHVSS